MRTTNRTIGAPYRALALLSMCIVGASCSAQEPSVTLQIQITKHVKGAQHVSAAVASDASDIAAWLLPVNQAGQPADAASAPKPAKLIQRDKTFVPHLLVVQTGAAVQFPNEDPFFHNVFSLFDGKRFDLGLYESGTSRTVHFERSGVSFLFCNIHSEMNAVVLSVDTPYFGVSDKSGKLTIPNVPDGRYRLQVYYERSSPEDLKTLERIVSVADGTRALGTVQVNDNEGFKLDHKNMYGQDYVPPSNTNPSYH